MIFTPTKLKGAFIVDMQPNNDHRGFFARSYCEREFKEHGIDPRIVQANVSYNHKKGTMRGMHYSAPPVRESKFIRCTKGAVYDVIIDCRKDSPTHLQWIGVELTEDNHRALYVPPVFGHGFVTLRDDTEVTYLVGDFYQPGSERGLRYDDPVLKIEWPTKIEVISEKDKSWKLLDPNKPEAP